MHLVPPASLGRGIVLDDGAPAPEHWSSSDRVVIDAAVLAAPSKTIARLAVAWAERTPLVVELRVPVETLRTTEVNLDEPYTLPASFEFTKERLQFLVWANNYDGRNEGDPIWWHARKAERIGASPGLTTDVVLPDGRAAWCDGGPRGPVDIDDLIVHRESIEMGSLNTSPARPRSTARGLAADQNAAVNHAAGPARIIAPAGSGKTRTLTARLTHLVRDRWVEPELITAVAYNAKAAKEMTERLDGAPTSVRTIHSLAFAIVRTALGEVTMLNERDQRSILAPMIPAQPVQNRDITAPYLEALTSVRIGLIEPSIVEDQRDDAPGFAEVYDKYRQELQRRNALDFDEQIYQAIQILLTNPQLRQRVRGSARHLLVDEFQDLTPAYLLLLRLVAAPAYQLFGVGDDDQVIYGYAGADPSFLIDFDDLFPGAGHYALETNYRSPAIVVEAAKHLLSYNDRRIPKSIVSPAAISPPDLRVEVAPSSVQGTVAADIISGWLVDHQPHEVAVLSRVNHALLPVQAILTERGIRHTAPVGADFLRRTAVRAFLAYLRLGLSPEVMSRDDLREVLGRPPRRMTRVASSLISSRSRWSLGELAAASGRLEDRFQDRFDEFVADLETVANAALGSTSEVVEAVRKSVGLDRAAMLLDQSRKVPDRSGHQDDLDAISQLADLYPDPIAFQSKLESLLAAEGSPSGVMLSTIHKVKGAEWPCVLVYHVTDGVLPHQLADDEEEERRVFHVAMTRGIESVAIVGDQSRPSPFIAEMSGSAKRQPKGKPGVRSRGPVPPATGGIAPSLGDRLRWGGYDGAVVEFGDDGAVIELATGARLTVPWRERVRVGSISAPLARPTEEADPALVEALKQWRTETARAQNVPAYIVLTDKHLIGIAARRPTTIEELLDCPGIGSTKAETYGEAILEAIEG
ncbi:MAG: ATP-dependent DNA helicase UvrD2 [Acidimicrobiia bacterium]|nr:ATP-dependent DNA helicase UvrD2 [Acidimicrobiia bacterium]MDH5502951.1 ATP-dependent DNA helicase UvrD2 [Acidimicrobiia bacterium]